MDNGYMMPTFISVFSMCKNISKNYLLELFFLVAEDFTDDNLERLHSFEDMFLNVTCSYIKMGKKFKDVSMSIPHITYTTYFRLLLPEILKNIERCIYLDGDTLVLGDIAELCSIELSDHYIAGVKAPTFHIYTKQSYFENIELNSQEQYVNAGVLVMNLKKMREDNLVPRFLQMVNKKYPCQDQDILNIICYNHILLLPLKYNAQVSTLFYPDEELKKIFLDEEIIEARKAPVVVHFSYRITKPWISERFIFADLWWEYFRKTEYRDYEVSMKQNIAEMDRPLLLSGLLEKVRASKECVIFGYTDNGKYLLDRLYEKGVKNIDSFCDNDSNKYGQMYNQISVKALENILLYTKDPFFLISSQKYAKEIRTQLLGRGIKNEKIFTYIKLPQGINRALRIGEKEEYI